MTHSEIIEFYNRVQQFENLIKMDEFHNYTFIGKPVKKTTTQILKELGISEDYSKANAYALEKARVRGEWVHGQLERIVNNDSKEIGIEVDAFKQIIKEECIEPLCAEFKVGNEFVCGTIDFAGLQNGKIIIADHKTCKNYNEQSVKWQLSIYAYLLGIKIEHGYCFHYPKNGIASAYKIKLINKKEVKKKLEEIQ